ARWVDGVYDTKLLAGSPAVSGNIANPGGFTVFVSDRRGDRVRATTDFNNVAVNSSNGMVDNEDIYGANGLLEPGKMCRTLVLWLRTRPNFRIRAYLVAVM